MPELPEVETIRRQLEKLVVGKTISSIEALNPLSFRVEKDNLIGKTIVEVGRKGKVLILYLKRSDLGRSQGRTLKDAKQIFVHLKMSGRLEFINRNISNPSKKASKKAWPFLERPGLSRLSRSKHLRVAIGFTGGSHLLFHDQRKFGWITDDPAVLPWGIDALDPKLTPKKLEKILQSSNRPIKTILLDQSKIAGIGNIYASEILWQAKINPATKGRTFCAQSVVLVEAIRKILTEAIKSGGSTMDDGLYQQVGGESGSYWSRRRVYDREGEPCLRCKSKVKKGVISQRSTYWCPVCQMVR